ncbi:MAG: hypothetical protein AAFP98_00685 [Pseudomonadota bacterium]
MPKMSLAAAALSLAATTASANHYLQGADPQVVGAINEMVMVLNQACNYGNGPACNAIPMLQQQAHLMLSAGYDCQYGGQQAACNFYSQNYQQLSYAYQQTMTAFQSGYLAQNTGGGAGMGLTHAQRMQQIHDWGAQRLAYGNQVQQTMETSQQNFLETLRQ